MRKLFIALSNARYLFLPGFLKLLLAHSSDIYKLTPVLRNRKYSEFLSDNADAVWKAMPFLNRDGKFHINLLNRPLKIVVGASDVYQPGWIATDAHNINILKTDDFSMFFMPDSIDAILAEHVWEHLSAHEGFLAAVNCYKYLRPGGYLRIAVPDGFNTDSEYIRAVKPGGTGLGSDDHKELYNYITLSNTLSRAKFRVSLLEYYDQQGVFHENQWDVEDGLVTRSRWHDPRNDENRIRYSSLIIDAIK